MRLVSARTLLLFLICASGLLPSGRAFAASSLLAHSSPRIVASVAYENQTAAISPRVIYTARKGGQFRVTWLIVWPFSLGNSYTLFNIAWQDDYNANNLQVIPFYPGVSYFIRIAPGGSLTIGTSEVGSGPYSLYVVVERL
jgi:hypothetical protein